VHRVLSDATDKLFEVAGRAVATFGFAFVEERNIAAHMRLSRAS
jgi:alkylation response protein AidB-like acyl-CoA dehydrogenase